MRRREKVQGVSSLSEPGTNSVEETTTESLESTTTRYVHLRRSGIEKFLDSENNKSDYEWLLAAPETGGEEEAQENSMVKLKQPKAARSTVLKPRVENIMQEPVTLNVKAFKKITRLDSSTAVSKQSNTIADSKTKSKPSRQTTPTPRTTVSSTRPTNSACRTSSIKSNPRASRSSSVGKSVPTAAKSTSLTIREIPARPISASRGRGYSSGGRSTGRSSKISDDVNPVLMGTQMVERVVNMRKLPPPKHDDNNMNSGFGRTLSRSSLDMAMRHMFSSLKLLTNYTDIISLNDMTRLRNGIGVQTLDQETKKWKTLNNAVMVFDPYHPLMREFLHEYAATFNGNKWGYNSPCLVTKFIKRLGHKAEFNLTILPPDAFLSSELA
ncbi:BnaA04g21840D [Brassica napus]|uniref:BnaA04g21840D protein n=1 Tax=Brassica napus TaxID=3708 RepID=A0A078G1A1_BRANA|nr:BnaA04g21840D [Brassica napus]